MGCGVWRVVCGSVYCMRCAERGCVVCAVSLLFAQVLLRRVVQCAVCGCDSLMY